MSLSQNPNQVFFPLPSAGLVSATTQAEPCFFFFPPCPAVVVQSELSGLCPPRARVQAAAAARVASPAKSAGLCSWKAPWYPQGEGVFSGAAQQGVCLTVAQPQAGGVWDQVQHGEIPLFHDFFFHKKILVAYTIISSVKFL